MARVLLVKVRTPNLDSHWLAVSPPLGLLHLTAYARRERPGRDVFRIVDERIDLPTDNDYRKLIANFKPDVIGLSVLSTEAERMRDVARLLKTLAPGVPLLAGGPHVTAEGARVLQEGPIDYLLRGESEIPFVLLLNALERGDRWPDERMSGVIFRRPDGTLYDVPYNTQQPEVETLPIPAWDLIDLRRYAPRPRMTPINYSYYAPLFTSRGCPYRCIYCHDVFKKGFRAQSPLRVVDEIEHMIRTYDVHDFEIYDDIFNADYDRTMEIYREIKRRGLKTKFTFPNGVRGDRLDKPLIEALASVGCYHMAFAVESASPRVQKLIRKHNKLDVLAENIGHAADAGIFAWGFFMLGFPTETREELWQTVNFAVQSKLHGAFFFVVVPFGGTELHKTYYSDAPPIPEGLLSGEALQTALREASGIDTDDQSMADYHFSMNTLAEVGPFELKFIQQAAYWRFWYDPRRMYRIVRDYPAGYAQLARKAAGFTWMIFEDPMRRGWQQLGRALKRGGGRRSLQTLNASAS